MATWMWTFLNLWIFIVKRIATRFNTLIIDYFKMHQSIPAAPSPPPPGYCGAFARLVSPWGGAFANFVLPGGRAFANPGAIPKFLTRTRFPI